MGNAEYGFVVGYNGYAQITSCFNVTEWYNSKTESYKAVRETSANIMKELNIPTVNSYYLPYNTENDNCNVMSPIRLGQGTCSFNGQISMELSSGCLSFLDINSSFIKRNTVFNMQFYDGQNTCTAYNCMWNSIKISCQAESIPTMSISFISNNASNPNLSVSSSKETYSAFNSNDLLVPYWKTGIRIGDSNNFYEVSEFDLSLDRNVTPIYLNNNLIAPTYLRAGLINVNLNFTLLQYDSNLSTSKFNNKKNLPEFIISLGYKKITLKIGDLKSESYGNATLNDTGNKSYSFTFFAANNKNENEKNIDHIGTLITIMDSTENNTKTISETMSSDTLSDNSDTISL